MADIEIPVWRNKSRIGNVMSRVLRHAEGEIEMSATQLKAAELYLRKTVPNLNNIEMTGKDGGALSVQIVRFSDNNQTPGE